MQVTTRTVDIIGLFGIHYNDVIMGAMTSQITSLTIVYSTVYSGVDQRKHQSSASLAFVRGIHRWPVNSPHKWPVTRKMVLLDDVIMNMLRVVHNILQIYYSSIQGYCSLQYHAPISCSNVFLLSSIHTSRHLCRNILLKKYIPRTMHTAHILLCLRSPWINRLCLKHWMFCRASNWAGHQCLNISLFLYYYTIYLTVCCRVKLLTGREFLSLKYQLTGIK